MTFARAPRVVRRLTPVPSPYRDETLGSWTLRLARGQHATRETLIRALAGDQAEIPYDLDVAPPAALLATLARRTGFRTAALRRLTVPSGARLVAGEGEPHCPVCWEDPRTRYVHRAWRERWSVVCRRHGVLLKELRQHGGLSVGQAVARERRSWRSDFPIELGWMIQEAAELITELEAAEFAPRLRHRADPRRLARARQLRDLTLLAGTRFAGGSLVEWTLPAHRGPGSPRPFYWCDAVGHALPLDRVDHPAGSLILRQHALRVATLLWLRAYGWPYFEEWLDAPALAAVALADSDTDLAMAVAERVREWPPEFQARWRARYGNRLLAA